MTPRIRVDLEPELPRAGKIFGVVVFLLLVGIAVAIFWTAWEADAAAPKVAHRNMFVHAVTGDWAYEPTAHPRMVLTPKGTREARQMRRAIPGDVYHLSGGSHGRFVVTGVIDVTFSASSARFYDRRMHIVDTAFFVYLDRVVKP